MTDNPPLSRTTTVFRVFSTSTIKMSPIPKHQSQITQLCINDRNHTKRNEYCNITTQITYVHKTQPCWNTSSHPHPIPHYSPLPLRHSERVYVSTASPRSPLRTTSSTSCCSFPAPGRSYSPPSPSPSTPHHIHSHLRFATTVSTAICDCPRRRSVSSASPPQWAHCADSRSGRCISPSSSRTTTREGDTPRQPRPHTR